MSALMVPGTDKLSDPVRAQLQNSVIGRMDRPFEEQLNPERSAARDLEGGPQCGQSRT